MRTVGLISGGKDSCFNLVQCLAAGHEIVALANLRPHEKDELDSYMFQSVGHDAIHLYSELTGLPLYREYLKGTSLQQTSDYQPTNEGDEVEDLYRLLLRVKETEKVEAVAVGAILSNYQRVRVENVCSRLGLTSLSYLWRRDQEELLNEMIRSGMHAILIKVAALGLEPEKHLGKSLQEVQPDLLKLKKKFGINVCGEGGEYETMTLDCPLFKEKIVVEDQETVLHSKDPFAPVAYLKFHKLRLAHRDDSELSANYDGIRSPQDFCKLELKYVLESAPRNMIARNSTHLSEATELLAKTNCYRTNSGVIFLNCLPVESEDNLPVAMEKFKEMLQKQGIGLDNLLSVCLYLRDMADYPKVNAIYGRYFNLNPPTRVCVEIPLNKYAIIEAIAAPVAERKQSMHVQSISHWAPANIGPYSQSTQIDDVIFVSGVIGLIPGSMTLPQPTSFEAECRLALRHADRILNAMDSTVDLSHAIQVVCFICDATDINDARRIWNECGGREDQPLAFVVIGRLPRGALVEWQIWAHREDHSEVISQSTEFGSIHIIQKPNAATFIYHLDELPTTQSFYQSLGRKLGCTTYASRIYYKVGTYDLNRWTQTTDLIDDSVSLTFVPVWDLEPGIKAIMCGLTL